MLKGKFKTAHEQREIPIDVAVIGTNNLAVGALVTFTAAADGKPDSIAAATSKDAATHMIAQSDTTMSYGHVPVEHRDWRYSEEVKTTASTLSTTSPVKKVALFKLIDKNDVVEYTV